MVLFFARELFTSFYVSEIESGLIKQTTTLRCCEGQHLAV